MRQDDMKQEKRKHISIEELNPTFLFTWKGTRNEPPNSYHCHDYFELVYILSGKGKYHIEGKMYDVEAGDLIILNPGVMYEAVYDENNETPNTDFMVGFTDIQIPGYPQNYLPVPEEGGIIRARGELKTRMTRLCSLMEEENQIHMEGTYFMLKALLMQMLVLVIREQSEEIPTTGSFAFESLNKTYVVEKIISYFKEHYDEKISLDQIAENMYLSPFYISKIFKSEVGDTPIHYLINIRLEKAKQLLEVGHNGNIQEIAAMVGYEDAYHFSKSFKKRYGISPSQARKH